MCDNIALDLLKRLENIGEFEFSSLDIIEISKNLFKITAQQSLTGTVRSKVEMLTEFYSCSHKTTELPSSFADKFKSCVAKYVV